MSDVKLTYETCVYLEQLESLIADLDTVLRRHTGEITDIRVRTALAAAALVSVAQNTDGLLSEPFRVNGVSGLMREIVKKWN